MSEKGRKRVHHFEFPGESGNFSIELEEGCFSDIDSEELFRVGKIIAGFLYGLFLENREVRESTLNIFHSILKDNSIFIEDRDLNSLLRFSNQSFHNGDYRNSLFLSQLVLSRINQIIDKKIADNNRTIDKEIIHLQISTLNFIGYLFSKTNKNIEYGIKLAKIADILLNEFDENNEETISLRAAIHDTLGALYIQKEDWDKAINYLLSAQGYDQSLLKRGSVDEIGFRLTCSNLGYALVQKCKALIENSEGKLQISQIEEYLEKANRYFLMVQVDKPPPVPESHLQDLELLAAIRRMKQGQYISTQLRKELGKRLL